jgi:tetratricopeptide (TPR) repeat protein
MQIAKLSAILMLCVCVVSSCNFKKKWKDTETNEYYAEYVNIYKSYKKTSVDTTKNALVAYLQKFPQEAKAWSFLGSVYVDQKNYIEAIQAFEKALSIDSNLANPYSALGFLQYKKKDIQSAKAFYLKGIAKGDSSLQTQINLLLVLSKTLPKDTCKAAIDKLITKKITQQQLLFSIGCLYHRVGAIRQRDSIFSICEATKLLTKATKDSILLNDNSMDSFMESISN